MRHLSSRQLYCAFLTHFWCTRPVYRLSPIRRGKYSASLRVWIRAKLHNVRVFRTIHQCGRGWTRPDRALEANWAAGKPSPRVVGASTALWLHRAAFSMSFKVENTGTSAGTGIAQVYLHYPVRAGESPSVLRGFTDVELQPGEAQSVTITL